MATQEESEGLRSDLERLRAELAQRAVSDRQHQAMVEVLTSELERLRRQIRALEVSEIPIDVQENARLKAEIERFRVIYDNHNATVARLRHAIESHHPAQPTCDSCLPALRSTT